MGWRPGSQSRHRDTCEVVRRHLVPGFVLTYFLLRAVQVAFQRLHLVVPHGGRSREGGQVGGRATERRRTSTVSTTSFKKFKWPTWALSLKKMKEQNDKMPTSSRQGGLAER
jgi:hypothetical protein